MKIKIAPDYQSLSERAAQDLLEQIGDKKSPLLCTASGDSPAGLYQALARLVKEQQIDVSQWRFVSLDEWVGMNGSDEGSCRWHLGRQLFEPLGVQPQQICFFDGRAQNGEAECNRVEQAIREAGGIDVAIVGIGLNGHIGMNEPGTPAHLRSHVALIDPQTQQTGQKYFKTPRSLTHGLTLGMQTLLESKCIFLMVSGTHKAGIVAKAVATPPSETLPATLLQAHDCFIIYADDAAAAGMHPQSDVSG